MKMICLGNNENDYWHHVVVSSGHKFCNLRKNSGSCEYYEVILENIFHHDKGMSDSQRYPLNLRLSKHHDVIYVFLFNNLKIFNCEFSLNLNCGCTTTETWKETFRFEKLQYLPNCCSGKGCKPGMQFFQKSSLKITLAIRNLS